MNAEEEPEAPEEEERWLSLMEPVTGKVSERQELAIRRYAMGEGFDTLRGYWKHLESLGWDYYDVLKAFYARK